jgi:Ca2+-binding EF-hand superfamily protein
MAATMTVPKVVTSSIAPTLRQLRGERIVSKWGCPNASSTLSPIAPALPAAKLARPAGIVVVTSSPLGSARTSPSIGDGSEWNDNEDSSPRGKDDRKSNDKVDEQTEDIKKKQGALIKERLVNEIDWDADALAESSKKAKPDTRERCKACGTLFMDDDCRFCRVCSLKRSAEPPDVASESSPSTTTAPTTECFVVGDMVTVVKDGSCSGLRAKVIDPVWGGRVQVRMEKNGLVKGFLACELQREQETGQASDRKLTGDQIDKAGGTQANRRESECSDDSSVPDAVPRITIHQRKKHPAHDQIMKLEKEKIGITDEQIKEAFFDHSVDNEVHHDDIPAMMLKIGFPEPQIELIEEVWNGITKYRSVDLDDFLRFVRMYIQATYAHYKLAFDKYDLNQSGTIEHNEILCALKEFSLDPMEHVVWELMHAYDSDNNGTLDYEEFVGLLDTLRRRQGFSTHDYVNLVHAFQRFDEDANGQLDVGEFCMLLAYQGYSLKPVEAEQVVATVADAESSGLLNLKQFLYAMRRVRAIEVERIKKVVDEVAESTGRPKSGTISPEEMMPLLLSLGHWPDIDALMSAATDVGFENIDNWDICKLWQVLIEFRARQGLSPDDVADVEKCFDQLYNDEMAAKAVLALAKAPEVPKSQKHFLSAPADPEQKHASIITTETDTSLPKPEEAQMRRFTTDGEVEKRVSVGSMRLAIQALGHSIAYERVQFLICQVDITHCGALDLDEFKALFRMARETDIQVMRDTFRRFDSGNKGFLSPVEAVGALEVLKSQYKAPGQKHTFEEDEGIDEFTFFKFNVQSREVDQHFMKDHFGFSMDEEEIMRVSFAKYDVDTNGSIDQSECVTLIEDLMPELSKNPSLRKEVLRLLDDIHAEDNKAMEYRAFLKFRRGIIGIQDRQRYTKQRAAIQLTNFSDVEVYEFRRMFLESDFDQDHVISMSELASLVGSIVPLGHKNEVKLRMLFDEALVTDLGCLPPSYDTLDFPQFLVFMRSLDTIDLSTNTNTRTTCRNALNVGTSQAPAGRVSSRRKSMTILKAGRTLTKASFQDGF